MNCLKVFTILCVLFIFCGAVYGTGDADSLDTQEVSVDEDSAISNTVTVEGANLTYDKLVTNNGGEVVIGEDSNGNSSTNDKTSVPDISLNKDSGDMSSDNPANVFINESFNFQMIFKNLGDTTGFQPYIQFIAPEDLTQFTATYLDRNIVPIKVGVFDESTYDNQTGLYTLIDPFTKKEVHGSANSTFYILQYPLGSFTVDAPDAILNITARIGDLDIGKLINFTVTPVFRYGNSPVDDPVNYPPIYGESVTGWINPVVVKIDKGSSLHEDETATGSNFPFDYYVNINIANGAKIENITITDVIPTNIMYLGSPVLYNSKGQVIDPSLYTIEEPTGNKTGGKIVLKLSEAIGELNIASLSLRYKAYAPEFDNSTDDKQVIIDPETGIQSTATNIARIDYTYANNTYNTDDSYNVYLKSLATQKYAGIQKASVQNIAVVPMDIINYQIKFEVSDYFAFDDIVIFDELDSHGTAQELGSAQKILTEKKIVLSIYGKTYELNASYYDIVSHDDVDHSITFYISKFLKENNITDSLKGGYYTNRSVNEGAMIGSLNFSTKVVVHYSNGTQVVSNDIINNKITTSGTVLNTTNMVSDTSDTRLQVPTVTLSKNIIAINGEIVKDSDFYKVYPGENVTFLVNIYFPTGSVKDFVLTDFLPIPLFSVDGFSLVNSTTGIIPKGGYWAFANDTGYVYDEITGKIVVPKVTLDSTNNDISFTFGNTWDNLANPVNVKLWFTLTVSSEPMADQLNLANLAQIRFKDSINMVYASSNIVLMITNEPELNITKHVNETKILEDIENATYVKYNITINSIGNSNAYDIVIADDFVKMTSVDGITKADIIDISLIYSNGTVVNITAFKDDLFGKGYKISELAKNTSCSIIYTVRFTEYLVPKESIVNNVWITNFSAFPNSTNFVTNKNKYRDNATIIAKGLKITKEFIGSNVTDNTKILFVGEIGIYNIIVNLPDLRVSDLVIEDRSYGIKYTNFTITTNDGVVVPEYVYKVTYTPSTIHPESSYLTINFNGDLIPAYANNNQLIIKAYYTVVNNENVIPTGKDVATTSNYATISWSNNKLFSNDVYVDVYQPNVDISKIFEPNIVQGKDESSFTITITNNGKGTAYNTTITDDLADFINTFVGSASDIVVTVIEGNETGKITFTWNGDVATINAGELLASKSVKVKFTFTVKSDVVIGKEFKNTAKVDYYSIFNEEKFDEKRNYSNQASNTLYTYNATVNKTVFNTTIVNGKDRVTIGENITYNITMILPIGRYDPLEIVDTLPEGLSYIGGSLVVYYGNNNKAIEGSDYNVDVNGNIIKITFAQDFINKLVTENDGKCQLFFNATVLNINSNKAGVTRTNKAVLTWNDHESESSATVTIVEPNVVITKNFNVDKVVGGDIIYFDIAITNNGESPLFNVVFTDDLSDLINRFIVGDINVTSGGSIVTPTWNEGTATINIDEIGIGKSVNYRFTFKIKDHVIISSVYDNVANVIGYSAPSEGREYTGSAEDSFTTELPTITKWVIGSSIDNGKDNVTLGEYVYYGINVTLPTGNHTKLVIVDELPKGFDYIGAIAYYANGTKLVDGKDWTINNNNNKITITLNDFHSSDFANGILSVNLTARTNFRDTSLVDGVVSTNNVELFLDDISMGTSSAKVTIVEPTLDITKKFNVTETEGLEHVSFDVVITNNGHSPLFEIAIIEYLSNLSSFIGQTPSADNVDIKVTDENGNPIDATINWGSYSDVSIVIDRLNVSSSINAKFSFVVRQDIQIGSKYFNIAYTHAFSAPDYGRQYIEHANDTLKTKMPTITKWVNGSSINNNGNVAPGEEVYYGINVTLPTGNYTNLVIVDELPKGFDYTGAIAYYANGTMLVEGKDWTINENNNKVTITLKNNIHSSDFAKNILSITFYARPNTDESNIDGAIKVNNVELFLNGTSMGTSSAKVIIVEPTLDITKKFNVTYVEGLDHVSFDVILTNNGHTPLFDITINDDLTKLSSFIGQTPSADNVDIKVTDEKGNPIGETIWDNSRVYINVGRVNVSSSIHAKFSFVVSKNVQIGSEYLNNVFASGFSASDKMGRDYANESEDTLKTKMPTFSKVVIGTTLGSRQTDMFTVNIGENVTYQFLVNLPNGNYTNLLIKDILPQGLKYLENSAILSNGSVIKDVKVDGNTVTINFGNTSSYIYNGKLIFNLSVAVLNDTSNVDSAIKTNNAELYLNNTKLGDSSAQVKITEPKISVTKNADKQNYEYYENATYSIVITNNGVGTAFNITIKDVLPLGLKYTGINSSSKSKGWVVKFDEATQTFTIAGNNLTFGETFTFTYKVSFVEWDEGGIKYSPIGKDFVNPVNVAYVSINGTNPNNRTYTTQTDEQVHVTEADLSVSKDCNNEVVIAGEKIYYTIVIKNNGQDTAYNVVLNEYYHSEFLTNLEYSLDGKTWNSYVNPVNLGSLNSKASVTVYVRGNLDASIIDNEILNNTVRVNTTTGELKLDDNEATNLTNVNTLAELHIIKTNITDAIAGENIRYNVTITNNGPSYARDVVLTDTYDSSQLPSMLYSFDGKTWIFYYGTINLGVLANGESRTVFFQSLINSTIRGDILNTATITSSTKLRENSTLEDDVTVNVKGDTTLDLTKTANTNLVNPGDVIKYTIQVTAGGSSDSLDVILTDNLSEVFFDKSGATYAINGIDKGPWTGSLNLGTMKTGSSVNVVITVSVKNNINIGSFKPMLNNITNFASVINSDKKEANDTNVVPINIIDLAINKTANHQNKTYNYGDDVEYLIEIINNGPGIANNIIAVDELPDGFDFTKVIIPAGWSYTISNSILTISGDKLANGEKVSVTLIGKVVKSNVTILNNIKVNGTGFDSNISNNNDSETIKVTPLIDLAIIKTVNNATPLYNSTITYTITVVNNGPDGATNVLVKDIWPANGVKFISSDGSYNPITGIWTIGDLANGANATLTITGQTIAVGEFENKVSVNGTGYDRDLSNNNASVNITVPESVMLNIIKIATDGVITTGDTKDVIAGNQVIYTVTVSNLGPSRATNVYLTDLFDTSKLINMEYNLDGNWVKYENGIALGNIEANKVVTILFRTNVSSSTRGLIENTVKITTDVKDARGNFSDDETINAIGDSTLDIIKTSSVDTINPGELFNYTIEITAKGSSDSLGVVLTDILDQSLLDVNSANFYVNGKYVGKWNEYYNLGNLKTGDKVTVTIEVRALTSANKDIFNKAIVKDDEGFTNESNTTVHVNTVDLAVEKLVNNTAPKYLDNIEYTIVVVNNGPDKSFNVTVRDLLPDGVKFISSTGQYDPETGVWFIGDLDNKESATLKIIVQVIKVGETTNNVNVTGTGFDTNLTNNNDSVTVTVPDCVILDITKVANSTTIVAGENVTYTVVITNNGPSDATDVVLSDIFNNKQLINVEYSFDGDRWLEYNEAINLGTINAGTNITVYFRSNVNASTRGDVLNIVNITTGVDDARGNFSDNETIHVIANTTLVVIKDAEIKALNPGDVAHFIITVIAGGSSDSLNVNLEDILDSKLLDVNSATYRINGGNLNNYTQIISLGNIATGDEVVVDIYATILNTTGQDVFNSVNVTSDEYPEGNTSNTTIHVNIADLEISKLVNNTTPNYGDIITYTIIVKNNGPDNSTNIKVSEILADNLEFILANVSKGQYNLTQGVWVVGNLTNNETAKLVITVKIVKTGFIQNNVSVNGTGYDPNITNNKDSVNITVNQTADLSVVKTVNVETATVGDKIVYTIIVKNNGPDTALNVYAVDKLSDALKFVSYKASVGVFDPTTGIWTIGNLTNGSNASLEITCIVIKSGIVSNDVFVNGSTVDLNMSNNYDNISVTVNPAPQPPAPVGPDGGDIPASGDKTSGETTNAVDTMAKTGNPIFAILVVLILGILGFGTSRRKK